MVIEVKKEYNEDCETDGQRKTMGLRGKEGEGGRGRLDLGM